MKVFAGIVLGVAMPVSMFYECFGVFILTLLAATILWLSTQPHVMDNDDYSKQKRR